MNLPFFSLQAIDLQTIIGLTGISILLSAILLRIFLFLRMSKQTSYLISLVFFGVSFICVFGDSINLYFRGLFNDLSITTLVLLVYYFIQPDANKNQTQPVFFLIAINGLFFYPMALGLGAVDPYSWGFINKANGLFPPLIFLILLGGCMVFALLKNYSLLLLSLVLATLTYQFGLLESRNLWDYLLDPLIFIYALLTVLSYLFSSKNKQH